MLNRNKAVISVVAGAFITAIVQDAAKSVNADNAVKAVNWIESIIGETAFPWVASSALTVTVIVWFWPVIEKLMNQKVLNIHVEDLNCRSTRYSENPYISHRTLVTSTVLMWSENGELYIPEWILSFKGIDGKRNKMSEKYGTFNSSNDGLKWMNESDPITEKPKRRLIRFDLEKGVIDGEQKFIELHAIDNQGAKFKGKIKF